MRYLDIDDRRARRLALAANQARADLSPIEETQGVLDIIREELGLWDDPNGESKTIEILSSCFRGNVSPETRQVEYSEITVDLDAIEEIIRSNTKGKVSGESFRTKNLLLLKLPPELKVAINLQKLPYTKVLEIAKVKGDEEQQKLLDRAIEEDLSVREIQKLVRELNGKSSPAAEATPLGKVKAEASAGDDEEEEEEEVPPKPALKAKVKETSPPVEEEEEEEDTPSLEEEEEAPPKPTPKAKETETSAPGDEEEEQPAPKSTPKAKEKAEDSPSAEEEEKTSSSLAEEEESTLSSILADFPLEHLDEPTDYAVDCLQLAQFILNALSNDNFDQAKMDLVKACLQQAIKYMGLS